MKKLSPQQIKNMTQDLYLILGDLMQLESDEMNHAAYEQLVKKSRLQVEAAAIQLEAITYSQYAPESEDLAEACRDLAIIKSQYVYFPRK